MWIKTITRIDIQISSLPYSFNINALNNCGSNSIQIDHNVKIINHNRNNISKASRSMKSEKKTLSKMIER